MNRYQDPPEFCFCLWNSCLFCEWNAQLVLGENRSNDFIIISLGVKAFSSLLPFLLLCTDNFLIIFFLRTLVAFFSLLGCLQKKGVSIPLVLSRNQYHLEILFTSLSAAIYVNVLQHSFKEKVQLKKHWPAV